jgi:hypothetical protein
MRERLSPKDAIKRLDERNAAAAGVVPGEQAVWIENADPEALIRRLLGDLLELEDGDELIGDVLYRMATSTISGFGAAVLRSLRVEVTPLDEPDENGAEHNVKIALRPSPELQKTIYCLVGQNVALGLLLRRRGDIVLPPTSPADEYRPSHWGRPAAE